MLHVLCTCLGCLVAVATLVIVLVMEPQPAPSDAVPREQYASTATCPWEANDIIYQCGVCSDIVGQPDTCLKAESRVADCQGGTIHFGGVGSRQTVNVSFVQHVEVQVSRHLQTLSVTIYKEAAIRVVGIRLVDDDGRLAYYWHGNDPGSPPPVVNGAPAPLSCASPLVASNFTTGVGSGPFRRALIELQLTSPVADKLPALHGVKLRGRPQHLGASELRQQLYNVWSLVTVCLSSFVLLFTLAVPPGTHEADNVDSVRRAVRCAACFIVCALLVGPLTFTLIDGGGSAIYGYYPDPAPGPVTVLWTYCWAAAASVAFWGVLLALWRSCLKRYLQVTEYRAGCGHWLVRLVFTLLLTALFATVYLQVVLRGYTYGFRLDVACSVAWLTWLWPDACAVLATIFGKNTSVFAVFGQNTAHPVVPGRPAATAPPAPPAR